MTGIEAENDRLRKRVAELEGTLRSVGDALPMIGADPEVARSVREEIERELDPRQIGASRVTT